MYVLSVFIISCFSLFHLVFSLSGGPAFIWTDKSARLSSVIAGHDLFSEDVYSKYVEPLNKEYGKQLLTVIFLQKELSSTDIIRNADLYNKNGNGGVYPNLKESMESYSSVEIPSITGITKLIQRLKKEYVVQEVFATDDTPDFQIEASSNIVIVHLDDPSKAGNSPVYLQHVDTVIGFVVKKVKAIGSPYVAIYTALKSARISDEPSHLGRHLLQDSSDMNATFFNVSDCIYFYATSVTFQVTQVHAQAVSYQWVLPRLEDYNHAVSTCSDQNGTLRFDYENLNLNSSGGILTYVSVMIVYGYYQRMWLVTNFSVTYSATIGSVQLNATNYMQGNTITASPYFSYHCSLQPAINTLSISNNVTGSAVSSIVFEEFQTQWYYMQNEQFGRPSDCVGFFTIPIWSGVLVFMVLIAIFVFGIVMLSSIVTMDRFDDPKGKTVTVNVIE